MKILYFLLVILLGSVILGQTAFAQTDESAKAMFGQAEVHFKNGQYKEAITIYDDILETYPNNISVLRMKGVAQSNMDEYASSLKQFFKVLQYSPNDVISLTGMGVGFGNLGEYQESIKYFEKASNESPDSVVIDNYKDFINGVISKYPYTPTQKPKETVQIASIPEWIKTVAKLWSEKNISDSEFNSALAYLIKNKILQIPPTHMFSESEPRTPEEIKNNAGLWADRQVGDQSFVSDIQQLVQNGSIAVSIEPKQKSPEELDHEAYIFERYLRDISKNISKEKRYIEYANPSQDVIKKFLRDYIKWNLEDAIKTGIDRFPNPTYQIENDVYHVKYKVFINDQPTGLPLDHVSTLSESFAYWEGRDLIINDKNAKIKFEVTNLKHEANVWVTWVVRNIGEGVLGHANLGKGVVEVTLGDYNCDGSFQLYDVNSIKTIMTHELGHSIGLGHVNDKNDIMYPSFSTSYAYCLLG